MKIDDKAIREGLLKRFIGYKDCTIFEEFGTASCTARADIVAVNGHIHGYEIKSDLDSLKRLEKQVKEYDNSFEMNTIVVGKKFKNAICDFVPTYWGIIISERKNAISYSFIRKAKINPNLNIVHMSHLLKKEEVYDYMKKNSEILRKYNFLLPSYSITTKYDLLEIITLFNKKEISDWKKFIREKLKKRKEDK